MTDDRPPRVLVAQLGPGLELWDVELGEIRPQSVNARSMTAGQRQRLEATIKRDGRLESLPLCADTGGDRIELVSGHNRYDAAKAAGLARVHVLVDVSGLTPSQVRGKQLAHNALQGRDDDRILREIFESIADVDARLEAFVDPSAWDPEPEPVDDGLASAPPVRYKTVVLTFTPTEAGLLAEVADELVTSGALEDVDRHLLVDRDLLEAWEAATRRVGRDYGTTAATTTVAAMVAALARHLGLPDTDPDTLDPEAWVSLATVLGTTLVPPDVAPVIGQAIDRLVAAEELNPAHRWQALEVLAANYLAGE